MYDRHFRQKASALRLKEWSPVEMNLWRMAFPDKATLPTTQSALPLPRLVHISRRGKYAWSGMTVPAPTVHTQTANLSIAATDAYLIQK